MSDKIPCGDLPERYPRTSYKGYAESSIWEKMGPDAKKKADEPRNETIIIKQCLCGEMIKTRVCDLPVYCAKCFTKYTLDKSQTRLKRERKDAT